MSSGDTTGAPISEKEKRNIQKLNQRVSNKYKALVEDDKNEFTPKKVTAWVGNREGGKMMKLTQHTAIQDIELYGKKGIRRGFIASSIEGGNTGYPGYFFIEEGLIERKVVGWKGVFPKQCQVDALTDFVTFDGESQSYIYIVDHRGKKEWCSVEDCEFVTFNPGVSKPPPQKSWKHDEWPVMKAGEVTLKKGKRFETRVLRCWEHTLLEETVHDDGIVTYTCPRERPEENIGDLPIFNTVFGLTQRDILAETLANDTKNILLELIRLYPPVSVWNDEGIDVEINDDAPASAYAAWLSVDGDDHWWMIFPRAAKRCANTTLIKEVLQSEDGFGADVVRLLHQNREGEANGDAVSRARAQATEQLVSRYKQELDNRDYRGSIQVDEPSMLSHVPFVFYHASLNYLRVRF